MAVVRIPPALRADAGGHREIELEAGDVGAALNALIERFPALNERILEGGALPAFLNVFVDGEDIRTGEGLATTLAPTSRVILLPAMAGGAPRAA